MTPTGLVIHANRLEAVSVLEAADVERAVMVTAAAEGVEGGEISVTFLDADGMAALGAAHLGRTRPADVIAFNLAEEADPLGDVYICPAVAEESAREYGVELREELLRLVVHGVLHVLGHDHPEGPERMESEMFRRQEEILSRVL
ncbi:MAG: rRNA maturation RNase YbeY [Gemmatimonadetes bacterium]|nr:rRNA maturation RNase YbeY [Gemmatimonadota bacterium]NIO30461.1 rRNA maturation RNase YbeY [Gemmatimonadota bacterium]